MDNMKCLKNKKTGNVYVVQNYDPSKHDVPSPAEIQKAKQSNNYQKFNK